MSHIEFTREIARRFNHIYGREPGFEDKARSRGQEARQRSAHASTRSCARRSIEQGDAKALEAARALLEDRRRTCRWATASGCSAISKAPAAVILPEPQALLTETPKSAGARRPEDVEVLRQHDRLARGSGRRSTKKIRDHADRSGARAAHRSRRSRRSARCGSCTWSTRTQDTRTGCSRAAAPRASAASNASSR